MRLKKGDKVICIKDYFFRNVFDTGGITVLYNSDPGVLSHISLNNIPRKNDLQKGQVYTVQFFSPKLAQNTNYLEPLHNIKIKINGIFDACFTIDEFNEHFITLSQLRKSKLNKIYENS